MSHLVRPRLTFEKSGEVIISDKRCWEGMPRKQEMKLGRRRLGKVQEQQLDSCHWAVGWEAGTKGCIIGADIREVTGDQFRGKFPLTLAGGTVPLSRMGSHGKGWMEEQHDLTYLQIL